jgi:hypothetical protein
MPGDPFWLHALYSLSFSYPFSDYLPPPILPGPSLEAMMVGAAPVHGQVLFLPCSHVFDLRCGTAGDRRSHANLMNVSRWLTRRGAWSMFMVPMMYGWWSLIVIEQVLTYSSWLGAA